MKEMDVEKIMGLERTFRIRVGRYKSSADKDEKTTYVTHIESGKKAYKKEKAVRA
ncbi:hypothetical protein KEJ49_02170 [Candidatus Bathyarchaeota archaeon]|nr:hypothetical protein [Candidatus Bathyarchaeota archaeon]